MSLNPMSEEVNLRERVIRSIEGFNNLIDQDPSRINCLSLWVLDRLTTSQRTHEISTSKNGWVEELRRGLARNSRYPIDLNTMNIAQFDGGRSLDDSPVVILRLRSPSDDMRIIRDDLAVFLSTKLSYTEQDLWQLMDHELEHFCKADELGVDLAGSTLRFRIYVMGDDNADKKLSLSVGMAKEIPPIEDMEICLAPTEPSEPDLARCMQLLTRLDLDTVDDMDRLYDVIRTYCNKSGLTFTTDIPELYREYRGVKLLSPSQYNSIEVYTRIEVNGKSYLFISVDREYITVMDDRGEHRIPLENIEVCVDR